MVRLDTAASIRSIHVEGVEMSTDLLDRSEILARGNKMLISENCRRDGELTTLRGKGVWKKGIC